MIHDSVELQNKPLRIPVWFYTLLCDIIMCISVVVFIVISCAIDIIIVSLYDLYNIHMHVY